MDPTVKISIVIPVFNEQHSLIPLSEKITEVMKKLNKTYEIIFVDDGSRDSTPKILEALHNKNKKIKVIQFYRNFGKSAALTAGFELASGDFIITMDGDLQDDPNEIPNFLDKIEQGYDLVVGWKYRRRDPITKILSSKIANLMARHITKVKIHDMNCCFKIYRKEVIKKIKVYGEMHRYIPALANAQGFRITEIKILHHRRQFGKSKYGFSRLFKGLYDFMTIILINNYIKRPMHFFGVAGTISLLLGFIIGIYLVILKFFYSTLIGNRPLLLLGILLIILGIQFISMGLVGEIIVNMGRNKEELYNIKKILK